MHRSGTSAYARMIGRMVGYEPRDPEIRRTNRLGQWEDIRLRRANDKILALAGCEWSAPSDSLPHALAAAAGDEAGRTALSRRLRGLGSEPWVWKDPRNCLTLPLWLGLDASPASFTVTVRHPLEVARSLHARNGFPLLYGVALWERYNRSMIDAVDGREALFISFGSLMSDAAKTLARTREWLERSGYPIHDPDPSDHVVRDLRHAAEDDDPDALTKLGLSPAQVRLYQRLLDRDGETGRVDGRRLLDEAETPLTSALLDTRRQVLEAHHAISPTVGVRLARRTRRWAGRLGEQVASARREHGLETPRRRPGPVDSRQTGPRETGPDPQP
ncbi:hypothetical protein [Myceligenerans indicum]|uniref:Sulfotransferase family protein n=1 Tax=Myceligenerans indicum TaxID=2593663 RepID=A0ABS1LMU7_9MICO|nr:hypothetical protein [Myceligenerans indicum]MBL0887536.1 hypothetical protein [Myceligenerans indicum]